MLYKLTKGQSWDCDSDIIEIQLIFIVDGAYYLAQKYLVHLKCLLVLNYDHDLNSLWVSVQVQGKLQWVCFTLLSIYLQN